MSTILLVDDEPKILRVLERALQADGHEVITAAAGREAQHLLAARFFDVVVADNMLPDLTGLDLLRELAATAGTDRPQVVMMTAYATIESAIEAMRLGAFDYLQKPFEVDELLVVVRRAAEHGRLRLQHRYLLSERDEDFAHYGFIGRTPRILELLREVELVAASRSTVLITGETGTGKELLARALHDRSAQRAMPLVKVNCAAIPDTLLESELFGHVRGAFTGAVTSKKGKFALADGSTIFLDEIATMNPALQAKLLRVLSESQVLPLGAREPRTVDIRVVSASHRPLAELVQSGQFRQDLLYRLNAAELHLPPLRQRRDLGGMMDRMLVDLGSQHSLGSAARAMLLAHPWPGNLRELNNVLRYAVALCGDGPQAGAAAWECVIEPAHLPDSLQAADVLDAGPSLLPMDSAAGLDAAGGAGGRCQPGTVVELEQLLAQCHGNVSEVARRLGVSRSTVHRRIQRLQLGVRCARWSKRPS